MKEIIFFRKQRELGSILSDTFKFIRLNWKSLFGLIVKTAGPALLIMIAAYVLYSQSVLGGIGFFDNMESFNHLGTDSFLYIFILLIAAIAFYALLNGTILHYIKSYIDNNGQVSTEEVRRNVLHDFWKLVGLSFLIGLIVGLGTMLCFIPGIYFWVVLSVAYPVIIFERRDVINTIEYCFQLVKDEWWNTFATWIVVMLLYYFISMIFQIPQLIYFFVNGFFAYTSEADPTSMFNWVYIIISAVAKVFEYLLYAIIVIASAFIYFNLHEKKYNTGTYEIIDSLGDKNL